MKVKAAPSRESAARRYRIEKYLTEGGMGAIYLGKKMGSGGFEKEVVLKQLLPEYTARPEFRDLFFREAKISATLDHANIVHTFDLVESDQSLFIVMEYVRGADLRTILRRARQRQRELSPAAAIHIALGILAGLNYAHARRDRLGNSLAIIHRDVSPSNIICSAHGEAKLSDFGIAKASTHSSVFYRVRGKVGYMSPEQARSYPIDHRCDLYSLAVCLYESLSGERLFVGDLNTPADEIYGHPIVPISQKRVGLPSVLDAVLGRALASDIEQRYQSGAEFADALRSVAHKTGLSFSAPELAAHLRDILGDDPGRWLREDGSVAAIEVQGIPAASIGLVGKEAASIGIVAEVQDDAEPPIVLNPRGVSGSKDFDIDSMLNDEATRPGGRGPSPARAEATTPAAGTLKALETPPPVWTRNSGPVAVPAPTPAREPSAPTRVVLSPLASGPITPPTNRLPTSGSAAAKVPPPPQARVHTRSAQRPSPPPPPPPRAPPPPPPPRIPPTSELPERSPFGQEFEDATPPPPVAQTPLPVVGSFDIDEATAPPVPARAHTLPVATGRRLPGRPYAPPASYPGLAAPASAPEAPQLNSPPTIDFSDSVRTLVPPIKELRPPRWLTGMLLVGAIVGGAVLADRATRDQVARVITAASAPPQKPPKKRPPPAAAVDDAPPQVAPEAAPAAQVGDAVEAPAPSGPQRAAPARAAAVARAHSRTSSTGHGKAVPRHKAASVHKRPAQRH